VCWAMKYAVYVRVSTNKEEQKLSLQNQKSLFYEYVASKGWDIYDFYVDVKSGTNSKRINLERMIQDAEQRKFDVILAKELSRLARNGELSYKIKRIAEENNIHIITLDRAINTLKENREMFGFWAWHYENESRSTSNRIKAALRSGAMRGEFKGSIPPYGYTVKEGKLVIRDDETPNIVKRIFREYLEGHGTDSIARRLYNDGIPPLHKLQENEMLVIYGMVLL
jgi:site-specific DNA recombinase